jgi:hypothetical protein
LVYPTGDGVHLAGGNGRDRVATGEAGELLVRGPLVMSGYYDDESATAAAVVDGWLHTGDVVRLTSDRYVTVTDRKKDIYIMGGYCSISTTSSRSPWSACPMSTSARSGSRSSCRHQERRSPATTLSPTHGSISPTTRSLAGSS